jgi:hypothetical protein
MDTNATERLSLNISKGWISAGLLRGAEALKAVAAMAARPSAAVLVGTYIHLHRKRCGGDGVD